MRPLLAFGLIVLALVCVVIAGGPLHNLWTDYQDSPDSTYLLFGLPFLAVAVGCVAWAVRLLRRP